MKVDEKILVVEREALFAGKPFQGFIPVQNFDFYEQCIVQHQQFLWRSAMEDDPRYKQIIPYLVFCHDDQFFMMRRRSDASEVRLKDKCSLGIGGHIRQEDITDKSLELWAEREFNEEVEYTGSLRVEPLGLINDDSNMVGQVHIGFVYLLEGDSSQIAIKSEHKEGRLISLDEMASLYDAMETWSQLVYNFLLTRKNVQAAHSISRSSREADNV